MAERPYPVKTGTFTDLIDELNRNVAERDPSQSQRHPATQRSNYSAFVDAVANSSSAPGAPDAPELLLRVIYDNGPQTVPALMATTQMGVSAVVRALSEARDVGLVQLEDVDGERVATLTEAGRLAMELER